MTVGFPLLLLLFVDSSHREMLMYLYNFLCAVFMFLLIWLHALFYFQDDERAR